MLQRILFGLVVLCFGHFGYAQSLVSFPGAMGFGNLATGGRGGSVYHVTNLNDAGTGSFRDAVSASNRIVVFDVGGYITLKTAVSISSNITIAGQTAPGEGIGFRGGELSCAKKSNIIIRYVRIRPGSETASSTDDALSLFDAHNIILDHCSFEFAPWNNIDGVSDDWQTYPVTDITFQYNLIANPIGQQFGAHCESVSSNWTWYYNAFVNSHNRNPLAKVNDVFVNNVLYNYEAGYTTHTSTNFTHDVIGNEFLFGPSTGTDNTWYQVDKNQTIYYSGNIKDKTLDGNLNGTETTPYWYQGAGTILTAPWSSVTTTNPIYSAATAFRLVTSFSGTLPYDQMDSLIWGQVNTLGLGTAGPTAGTSGPSSLYTSQAQTGLGNNGYGVINAGTKLTDTDNDGMPDFWESATKSNLNSNDAMVIGSDGYALIEKYLNWLGEVHARVLKNSYVDIDLLAFTQGFKTVSPTYSVASAINGSLSMLSSGHTVRFTPTVNYTGQGSFAYTVKGSDGTSYTGTVSMLVEPSNISLNPIVYVYTLGATQTDKSWTNVNNWNPSAVPSATDTAVIRSGEVQVSQDIQTITKVEPNGIFRLGGSIVAPDLRLQGGILKSYTSNLLYGLTSSIAVENNSTILAGSIASSVFQIDGAFRGSGHLTKSGIGALQLNNPSPNYTGDWILSEGEIRLGAKHSMGMGSVSVSSGAILRINTAGAIRGVSALTLNTDGTNFALLDMSANDTVQTLVLGQDTTAAGTYYASAFPLYLSGTASITVLFGNAKSSSSQQSSSSSGLNSDSLKTSTTNLTDNQQPILGYHLAVSRIWMSSSDIAYQVPRAGAVLLICNLEGKTVATRALSGTSGSVSLSEWNQMKSGGYILAIQNAGAIHATTLVYKPQ